MGPRIKAAGQGITPTGGHGDGGGFRDDIFPHLTPEVRWRDGVPEGRPHAGEVRCRSLNMLRPAECSV